MHRPDAPAVLLVLFILLIGVSNGMDTAQGAQSPPVVSLLSNVLFVGLIIFWFKQDCLKQREKSAWAAGWFCGLACPLILPYYLLKTRGGKAVLIVLALLGIAVGANLVGQWLATVLGQAS